MGIRDRPTSPRYLVSGIIGIFDQSQCTQWLRAVDNRKHEENRHDPTEQPNPDARGDVEKAIFAEGRNMRKDRQHVHGPDQGDSNQDKAQNSDWQA